MSTSNSNIWGYACIELSEAELVLLALEPGFLRWGALDFGLIINADPLAQAIVSRGVYHCKCYYKTDPYDTVESSRRISIHRGSQVAGHDDGNVVRTGKAQLDKMRV